MPRRATLTAVVLTAALSPMVAGCAAMSDTDVAPPAGFNVASPSPTGVNEITSPTTEPRTGTWDDPYTPADLPDGRYLIAYDSGSGQGGGMIIGSGNGFATTYADPNKTGCEFSGYAYDPSTSDIVGFVAFPGTGTDCKVTAVTGTINDGAPGNVVGFTVMNGKATVDSLVLKYGVQVPTPVASSN